MYKIKNTYLHHIISETSPTVIGVDSELTRS